MNRKGRAKIAQETLNIIELGGYHNQLGNYVSLKEDIENAIESSLHMAEPVLKEHLRTAQEKVESIVESSIQYEVKNCTTFEGVKHLLKNSKEVVCLNFASSKNPGGGFLGGSQAQEEALARASAMYPCLTKHMDMYLNNREAKRLLYSHDMIYSKRVPVFRNDNDELINEPFSTSIITSAAVNSGAVLRKKPDSEELINREMKVRARYILSLAISQGYESIVLGAWGCGVFKNEPTAVANIFFEILEDEGFGKAFRNILFAVLDNSKDLITYASFNDRFENKL